MSEVVLLIRSLEIGGAERQLVALAVGLRARRVNVRVLTFYPGGALAGELAAAGVPVEDLGKTGRWDAAGFLARLVRRLRALRPQVLYSFLPVSNVLAASMRPALRDMRVVWGVRASNMDLDRYDPLSRVAAWVEARLSRFADAIITNSQAGREYHIQQGFPSERIQVIENGIDTKRFGFDRAGRVRVRAEWGISDDDILIGVTARLDPMKGLETFIEAAAKASRENHMLRFVCVGEGEPGYAYLLRKKVGKAGLGKRFLWAGTRQDMPAVFSAFDIASSSSSFGEGFSNAVAEAMSCERVVVVTDVGDSARIVGDCGRVVPARDAAALALAFIQLAALSKEKRVALGARARSRIASKFSVERMVERTWDVLTR